MCQGWQNGLLQVFLSYLECLKFHMRTDCVTAQTNHLHNCRNGSRVRSTQRNSASNWKGLSSWVGRSFHNKSAPKHVPKLWLGPHMGCRDVKAASLRFLPHCRPAPSSATRMKRRRRSPRRVGLGVHLGCPVFFLALTIIGGDRYFCFLI